MRLEWLVSGQRRRRREVARAGRRCVRVCGDCACVLAPYYVAVSLRERGGAAWLEVSGGDYP